MDWIELISTLGFPIVCSLALALFCYRMIQGEREESNKREQIMREESSQREERLLSIVREFSVKLADLGRIVDENTKIISVLKEDIDSLKHNKTKGDE